MTKPIPVSAGFAMPVPIPGTDRAYTLRAPTFGQIGELAARGAETVMPSDAIFVDALRDAVRASALPDDDKASHLAALDESEDAEDAIGALYAAHGGDRTAWSDEARREIADAERVSIAARRRRVRAEWAMRDNAGLQAMRRHRQDAQRDEQVALVALCLGSTVADVAAMPAGDVGVLHGAAMRLIRPDAAAEKN